MIGGRGTISRPPSCLRPQRRSSRGRTRASRSLWDLGYLPDTSWRIALGHMPYRDFPLAHAPLTFLIQAAAIRLWGRHYFLEIAYAATAGGLATVLTWRILLRMLRGAAGFGGAAWLAA